LLRSIPVYGGIGILISDNDVGDDVIVVVVIVGK
jgi:hypothetical protein